MKKTNVEINYHFEVNRFMLFQLQKFCNILTEQLFDTIGC